MTYTYVGPLFRDAIARCGFRFPMTFMIEAIFSLQGSQAQPDDVELCKRFCALDDEQVTAFKTVLHAGATVEAARAFVRELCGLGEES